MVKLLIKISLISLCTISISYYLYFYINPSVTVINKSQYQVTEVNVKLPNSNLNFGSIESMQINSIYYSLEQKDGRYDYSFKIGNSHLKGTCGYITKNEFNKRFEITVDKKGIVDCN